MIQWLNELIIILIGLTPRVITHVGLGVIVLCDVIAGSKSQHGLILVCTIEAGTILANISVVLQGWEKTIWAHK